MSDNQVSDILAQAFAAEGVDTLFTLMGDANMYWSASMADNQKVRLIHARHEHCCVAMADAYARATGKIGVGSVTCGPGYTQIMTALAMAARGNAPVVVFAGDAPIGASWYIQSIDQAPLALATGAHFVPVRTIDRALDCVREAFYVARAERRPVVLSVPLDLQTEEFPYLPDYTPSTDLMPRAQVLRPDPALVDEIVAMVAEAERPIVLGGRGAMWSGAKGVLESMAQEAGALLATTLLGKGLFDGNPFALDIAGTFATDLGRELFAESDLVIAAGAGLYRRQMAPMHVIAIAGKIFSGEFPVARHDPFVDATDQFDAAFAAIKESIEIPAHLTEVFGQSRRLRLEGGEPQPLVAVELPHRDETPALSIQFVVVGFSQIRHADQPAVIAIGPAVIGTGECRGIADLGAAQTIAAMAADIEERANLTRCVTDDQDRVFAHVSAEKITRLRNLAVVAQE